MKKDPLYSIILNKLKQNNGEILLDVLERTFLRRNLSLNNLYEALIKLVNEKEIILCFEVRCPNCDEVLGTYSSIDDIPERTRCYHCGREFIKSKDLRYSLRTIVIDARFFRGKEQILCF